ncbi:hypothetical protein JQK88_32585 [Mesorhizobium caraganae]|uniref:hypothetical protein n=1 Tax=Mesorhizobium caraganae TaxID=483206 RepID=UPI001AEFF775|nr:hypothetical protein [Mesorhizobium caraganae]MBM2715849.1 hypothetical protein [Mesorhizobium caraganae]
MQVPWLHGPTFRAVELPSLKAQFLLNLVLLHRQTVVFDPSLDGPGEDLKFPKARHGGNRVSNVPQPIRMGSAEAAETCSLMGATVVATGKGLVPVLPEVGEAFAISSIRGHPRRGVSPLVTHFIL